MQKRLECKISGRVQFVMFRDFVCRSARKLGIVGTVQNTNYGTVYVIAEGEEKKLRELVLLLHKGSLFSKVKKVEDVWVDAKGGFSKFNIVY